MHAPLSPAFRAEWRSSPRSNPSPRNGARSPPVRSSPTCSTSRPSRWPRRRCSARRRRRAGADRRRPARRLVSGADRALARRHPPVLVGWTHPLRAARHAAGRSRRARGGDRRLARSSRPRPGDAGAASAAARSRARARSPTRSKWCWRARAAAAPPSAATSAPCWRPAAEREAISSARCPAGKRKELRRQRRRLEDIAPVTFATTTDAVRRRSRAEGFPGAGGGRLEGPRRHRHRHRPGDQGFRAAGGWRRSPPTARRGSTGCS